MPRTNALQTITFSGKSLEQWHNEMRENILAAPSPVRLEDTMSNLHISDPFARDAVKRSFKQTLLPEGTNYDLTQDKKWLKGTEKGFEEVEKGKVTLAYTRTTVPTNGLNDKVATLNGELSPDVREAASNIAATIAHRAGRKLDATSIAYVAEDLGVILSDNAALARENRLHTTYKEQTDKMIAMLQDVISKLPGSNNGNAVARR
jgi:hypothetical protein